MSEEAAQLAYLVILSVGILVWLFGLYAHRKAFKAADPADPHVVAAGEVAIAAPKTEVSEKAIQTLRGGLPGLGTVLLEQADDRWITGELTLPQTGRRPGGMNHRFEIELRSVGSQTAADYRVLGGVGGGLRIVSGLFVYFLTPLALASAIAFVPPYIVKAADPKIRYQVFQTAQIIHFLWPPFLFASVRGRMSRLVARGLVSVLKNTAF